MLRLQAISTRVPLFLIVAVAPEAVRFPLLARARINFHLAVKTIFIVLIIRRVITLLADKLIQANITNQLVVRLRNTVAVVISMEVIAR